MYKIVGALFVFVIKSSSKLFHTLKSSSSFFWDIVICKSFLNGYSSLSNLKSCQWWSPVSALVAMQYNLEEFIIRFKAV